MWSALRAWVAISGERESAVIALLISLRQNALQGKTTLKDSVPCSGIGSGVAVNPDYN